MGKEKNKIEPVVIVPNTDRSKGINWENLKLAYFLSPYRFVRRFLIDEKHFTEKETRTGFVADNIMGWEMEKKDWEKQALEVTMHNLRETKAVELTKFITEESAVVNQLLNLAKVAMNDLVTKKKDPKTRKDILQLQNTKGLKQVTDATLNILKYSRSRLGVPFEKEDEGMTKAINFNFDMVNLDEFNPEKVIKFFANKKKQNGQSSRKPNESGVAEGVSQIGQPQE